MFINSLATIAQDLLTFESDNLVRCVRGYYYSVLCLERYKNVVIKILAYIRQKFRMCKITSYLISSSQWSPGIQPEFNPALTVIQHY